MAEGEEPQGFSFDASLHIAFLLETMFSGDLLDWLAWLVHLLIQYARVRKR